MDATSKPGFGHEIFDLRPTRHCYARAPPPWDVLSPSSDIGIRGEFPPSTQENAANAAHHTARFAFLSAGLPASAIAFMALREIFALSHGSCEWKPIGMISPV